MRALLVGNYGVSNFGDDALRDYFLQAFPEVDWRVVSGHPGKGELPRLPAGIRSFLTFGWIRTLNAIRTADAVVLGGGTLFTDIESPRACFMWWLYVCAAALFGTPSFLAFQGIGPFVTVRGEQLARDAVRRAKFISVRDDESARRASSLAPDKKVVQTFDPVFTLFEEENDHHDTKKVLSIIPRHNSGKAFDDMVTREMQKGWDAVKILSFESDDPAEQRVCARLQEMTQAEIVPVRTVEDVKNALGDAWLVLTHRYHGAIAGLAMGKLVKVCSQAPGDKLEVIGRLCEEDDAGDRLRVLVRAGEQALRTELGMLN